MIARSPLPLSVLSLAAAVLLASCGGDGGGGTDVSVPTTMLKTAGDNQTGSPGTALPEPLEVKVTDDRGQAVPDFTVSFSTTAGSLSPQSMDTDADGRARTSLTLPNQSGTVTVTASAASVPSVSFTAEVVAGQLGFVTSVLPAGRTTIPYGRAIEVTGGTGSGYTFEITQGSLPSGMVLENDGSFSGAPTQTGAFPITVRVTDAEGTTASRAFTLNTCELTSPLAVGEVRVVDPAPFGQCGAWIPNDRGGHYYRVGVVRTQREAAASGARDVVLTVTGNGVTAAATVPPLLARGATISTASVVWEGMPDVRRVLAKQEATAQAHARMFREASDLARLLGPEGLVRPHEAGRVAAPVDLPDKLRVDVNVDETSCTVGPIVTAVKIAEDDRLAIYQDSTQNAGSQRVTTGQAQAVLDYYRDYGEEAIAEYFNGVPDIDGNGKVIVFVTPELSDGELGRVTSADMFSKEACPSSNEAELIYMGAEEILLLTTPDRFGLGLSIVVHEMKHVSSLWERLQRDEAPPLVAQWIEEGSAEIASTRAARLAWEAEGGPLLTGRVTRDDLSTATGVDISNENFALLLSLARVQFALSQQPHSLLDHSQGDIYGTGWLFLRWLGDAYGGAATGRHADASLFRSLNRRETPGGVEGLESVTGSTWETLLEEFLAAVMYAGNEEEAGPALGFTSWDFVTSIEMWCFALDPAVFEGTNCDDGSREPGPPGAFPWPVTTDPDGYTSNASSLREALRRAQSVSLESAVFEGPQGGGGIRVHDFLTNGTGYGGEVNVGVPAPAKLVIVRIT